MGRTRPIWTPTPRKRPAQPPFNRLRNSPGDMADGRVPDFELPVAPTPHPLANDLGALVSPLGVGGVAAFEWLSILSFVFLGWAAFRLGSELFSAPVGLVFSTIVMT